MAGTFRFVNRSVFILYSTINWHVKSLQLGSISSVILHVSWKQLDKILSLPSIKILAA